MPKNHVHRGVKNIPNSYTSVTLQYAMSVVHKSQLIKKREYLQQFCKPTIKLKKKSEPVTKDYNLCMRLLLSTSFNRNCVGVLRLGS